MDAAMADERRDEEITLYLKRSENGFSVLERPTLESQEWRIYENTRYEQRTETDIKT